MDKQYGGWYDNPATGRNQRWFNGQWTDGNEPGGGGSHLQSYQQNYDLLAGEVNKYADELIKIAQGDHDFAAKWIEQNYQQALGTDDSERAKFLKEVASTLEQKVGRIGFDYQTGKYRLEEDATRETMRTNVATQRALARLSEDEGVFRNEFKRQADEERQNTAEDLNSRGILAGAPKDATGLAGREIRDTNTDIDSRLQAFERQLGRDRQDITTDSRYALEDIGLGKVRGLEDLTTSARRAAGDEQMSRDYGMESAQRALERQKNAIEQQKKDRMEAVPTRAKLMAMSQKGLI